MDYFVRGRISSRQSCLFYVVFEEPKTSIILCRDFPDFFITFDLQDMSDVVIKSSVKSFDARFINSDTIRIDSIEDLSFWMEINIFWMKEECEKAILLRF